jgi:hypothetical protein
MPLPCTARSAPVGLGTPFIEDLASVGCECRLPIDRAKWTERHHQQWDELNALAKRLDAILIAGPTGEAPAPATSDLETAQESKFDSLAYLTAGERPDGQPRSNRFHEQKNRPGGGAGC